MTRQEPSFLTSLLTLSTLIVGACASVGCGTTREQEFEVAEPVEATPEAKDAATGLVGEGDAAWAERVDRAKLETALAKWEEASKSAPTAELYVKLARGHYFLADGFYAVEGNEEKRDAHYTLGLGFAEKAIALSAPDYVAALKAGEKVETAVLKAPPEAVPSLYWQATNLGKWAASKGFATRLKYKDDIKATMLHVKSLDENYFFAGPWRYFGGFEAATAGLAGGDLNKSKENFEQAIQKAPNYLGTKVLYADMYATKTNDKDLYKKLLEEVVAADPNAEPEAMPENVREQEKAKGLLAKIDDVF